MNALRFHPSSRALRALLMAVMVAVASCAGPAGSLTPADARTHVGEHATVCGIVTSAKFASGTRRQPTFLNLDRPYPDHIFTVVIWGSDRAAFGRSPNSCASEICK